MNINTLFNHLINKDTSVHVKPHIPKEKALNAISTYVDGIDADDIILLYDSTIMGSGKDGMVITNNAIYLKETFSPGVSYEFEYIPSLSAKKYFFGIDIYIGKNKVGHLSALSRDIILEIIGIINDYLKQNRNKKNDGIKVTTITASNKDSDNKKFVDSSEKRSLAKRLDSIENNAVVGKKLEIDESSNNKKVVVFSEELSLEKEFDSIENNLSTERMLEADTKYKELNELNDDELIRIVNGESIFARSVHDESISLKILIARGYSADKFKQ